MRRPLTRKLINALKAVVFIYILLGIGLYFLQERFLFHPQPLPAGHRYHFDIPFKEIDLPVNEEKNLNIVRFTVPDSVCKGVVLYFHGNRKNIGWYAPFATNFTRNNYEVWMLDYPGFGKSTGERTETMLYSDAILFYNMARARFSKDSIILYGKSIGTGIAAQLASVRDCRRLILETPYYSIDALMRHYAFIYPVNWMTKFHFPTYDYVRKIDVPITIFHGTNDEVIPFSHARRLLALAKQAELIAIPKGHHNDLNDSQLFQEKLDSVLAN